MSVRQLVRHLQLLPRGHEHVDGHPRLMRSPSSEHLTERCLRCVCLL